MDTSTDQLLLSAAHRALEHPYKLWGYGEGPALHAVLQVGERCGHPDLVDQVASLVSPSLTAAADEEIDHLIPVETLLLLERLRPSCSARAAVDRFVAAVADASRPVPNRVRTHRPHHPTLGRLIWVDCLHTDGPGLLAAGHADAAVDVSTEAVRVLQDDSGLFSHGYDVLRDQPNAVHWARGQGWALYGLVGLLADDPGRSPYLMESLRALVGALADNELDGRWTTIADDPASAAELSLSPMVAATVPVAVRAGLVDATFASMAERALAATLSAVRPDGSILVSSATPVGDHDSYLDRSNDVFPWGQGPLLDALLVNVETTDEKETR